MVGVLVTLLFSAGAIGLGHAYLRRWLTDSDTAVRLGLSGLIGLGAMGMLTFAIGLIPTGLTWGVYIIGVFALIGLALAVRDRKLLLGQMNPPSGVEWAFTGALAIAFLFALVGVLAPSDISDWDSLAYHLAVPKLWLQHGSIYPISFIHQSNFPFSIDALYIWGLTWGGQHGAKAFSLVFTLLGTIAIFGLTRERYGRQAAWWAALAFATVPVVLWESGTAYIDVGNGLFAGLGLLFAALYLAEVQRPNALVLCATCLGLAAGTKYTGLQTIFAVAAVLFFIRTGRKAPIQGLREALAVSVIALAIASPWYVKNQLWKSNPVFPFFYSKLGGKDWDQRRADIYTHEQQTFGASRAMPTQDQPDIARNPLEPARLGHSILGLAYQPGRYVNPSQDQGGGTPLGAVGVAIVGSLVVCLLAGARRTFEGATLAIVVISLAMWFVLSQQSRYIIALAVPLSVLLGGAVVRLRAGPLLAGVATLQAAYSLWLDYALLVQGQIPVVAGKVSQDEYLSDGRLPFYEPSKAINNMGTVGKVALYDEVFGYLLDVPYMWANPGHSTEIPYDSMKDGRDYAREMRRLGFTHIYINLGPGMKAPELRKQILETVFNKAPFPADMRQSLVEDWQSKFNVLVAEAAAEGEIAPVQSFPRPDRPYSILFEILPESR